MAELRDVILQYSNRLEDTMRTDASNFIVFCQVSVRALARTVLIHLEKYWSQSRRDPWVLSLLENKSTRCWSRRDRSILDFSLFDALEG